MEYRPFSLKPCPFCGSEVALTINPLWHDGHGYQGCFEYSVSCKNCGCRVGGSICDSVYFSEQEAIEKVVKAWNRRWNFDYSMIEDWEKENEANAEY